MGLFGHSVLGLQIDGHAIRLVQVALSRSPQVTAFAETKGVSAPEKEHPAGFDVGGAGEALVSLMRDRTNGSFTVRDCYLTLPEGKVFRKLIEVPAGLTGEELLETVRSGSAAYLPGDPDTMQIDYQVIAPELLEKADPELQYLAVVAVEKAVVQDYIALCEIARLRPAGLDTRSAALARALTVPAKAELTIIVACEADTAVVSLVEHGLVWATGLARLTTDADATAASIVDEIEHVNKFYANRTGKEIGIKNVMLTGAEKEFLADLKKALHTQLDDVPVDEAKLVVQAPEGCGLAYATAIGAALYPLYSLL